MYREKKTVLPAFRRWTAPLRMLPSFAILSVERGGTTSLYRYLGRHPDVREAFRKEVHYFDMNHGRGERWYRAHFPLRAAAPLHRLRSGHALVTGEASPYYLYHPHVAERMRALLPAVRLVALVRNPVERAFSHYQMNVRQKKETLSFEEAVDHEAKRLAGEWEKLVADPRAWSEAHYRYGYLARGLYAERLEAWGRVFPSEQMLVVRSEDLYADPAAVVEQVERHVGLRPVAEGPFEPFNQKPYPDIAPETRARLAAFFAPHNRRLEALLGRELGWS